MKKFFYPHNGKEAQVGDRVIIKGKRFATVIEIPEPYSEDAIAWGVPEGGICTKFDDGDFWFWPYLDEDIILCSRSAALDISSIDVMLPGT